MSARCPPHRAKTSKTRSTVAAFVVAVFVLAPAISVFADDPQEFEVAKTRFDVAEYGEAARLFAALLDSSKPACEKGPTSGKAECRLADPYLIERARALDAASLVALGRSEEADVQFETILRNNASYAPNPAVLPSVVIDRFNEVKTRMKPELDRIFRDQVDKARSATIAAQRASEADQKWLADIQRLASEERIVQKNSRAIALIPFGVGQFQNGDRGYGALFLASEVLLGGAAIAAGVVEMHYIANATTPGVDNKQLETDINNAQIVNVASFASWATVSVLGILQAQVAFVPERATVRARPIPPRPSPASVAPTVAAVPGGMSFGLVGRF